MPIVSTHGHRVLMIIGMVGEVSRGGLPKPSAERLLEFV